MVLDYDETIVENTPDFYEAYCEALRVHGGMCPNFEDFENLFDRNALHEKIPSGVSVEDFWKTFRRLYLSKHSRLKRGIREFLQIVKLLGVKVVVVSGREVHGFEIIRDLRKQGIDELIDDVLTIWDLNVLMGKEEFLFDKSYLISYAKIKHGVQGVIVCIGDYVTDYYSCLKSGGIFIGINSSRNRGLFLKKAGVEVVVSDFIEAFIALSEMGLLR